MSTTAHGLHFTHRHVVHPSDFSPSGGAAFRHALKLALQFQSHLTILHIDPSATATNFDDFPRVRPLLARWGLLPENCQQERVQELGLFVRKIRAVSSHPVEAIVQHVSSHPADLVVLNAYHREGIARWLHRSVAAPIVRGIHIPTLFVPSEHPGFVSEADGSLQLRHILLPAERADTAQVAADTISRLGTHLGCDQLTIHVLHVDDTHAIPAFRPPDRPGWTWEGTRAHGQVVDNIQKTSREVQADLVVMATEGHTSWSDTLHGSTTEQILRTASCPLLALPVN